MIPSFLFADHLLYTVKENGIGLCLEADTGKVLWQERIGSERRDVGASPLLAGGRIYYLSEQGETTVIDRQGVQGNNPKSAASGGQRNIQGVHCRLRREVRASVGQALVLCRREIMPLLAQWSNVRTPVIGMLHLPPCPVRRLGETLLPSLATS